MYTITGQKYLAQVLGGYQSQAVRNPQEITAGGSFDETFSKQYPDTAPTFDITVKTVEILPLQPKTKKSDTTGERYPTGEYSARCLIEFEYTGRDGKAYSGKVKCHACDVAAANGETLTVRYNGGEIPRTGQQPAKWNSIIAMGRKSEHETMIWLSEIAAKVPVPNN